MKKSILKTAFNFSALALALCISCGEKEDRELPIEDKNDAAAGVLKMKVNDADWSAKWAYTITTTSEEEEDDYFLVFITGATAEYTAEEDPAGDALSFYIAIPKAKFNNPVGTYSIASMDYMDEDQPAAALFNKVNGNESILYVSMDKEGEGKPVGSITIEKFKTGQQRIMGQDLGPGYLELAGSFTINEMVGFTGESETPVEGTLKLTNGKFDVKNGWNGGIVGMNGGIVEGAY